MTRRSYRKILLAPVLAFGLVVCTAAVAAPPLIESGFYGHTGSGKTKHIWQTANTYAWVKGVAARDPAVEAQLHATIDTLLAEKGWELTEEEADIYLKTKTERLTAVSIGVLRIDAVDDPSKKMGWRSLITDIVATKREKFAGLLDKTLKRAFKPFPSVKSAKVG